MKKTLSALALAALTFSGFAHAGNVNEMDARTNADEEGNYLLFVSKPTQEGAPMGDAFMALIKGDNFEDFEIVSSYGLILRKGMKPKAQDAADVDTVYNEDSARIDAVRIDEAQFESISELFAKWSEVTEFDVLPLNALLDATQDALDKIGFKRPYRSGLVSPHVMNYYMDIGVVNRKHNVE